MYKIALAGLFVFVLHGIFVSIKNRRELKRCSKETIAMVKKIRYGRRKKPYIKLVFKLEKETYEVIKRVNRDHTYFVGDSIEITYACSNPEIVKSLR